MDTIFADSVEFTIPTVLLTNRAFESMDEQFRFACECIGIELIRYASGQLTRKPDGNADVRIVSGRWILERQR